MKKINFTTWFTTYQLFNKSIVFAGNYGIEGGLQGGVLRHRRPGHRRPVHRRPGHRRPGQIMVSAPKVINEIH